MYCTAPLPRTPPHTPDPAPPRLLLICPAGHCPADPRVHVARPRRSPHHQAAGPTAGGSQAVASQALGWWLAAGPQFWLSIKCLTPYPVAAAAVLTVSRCIACTRERQRSGGGRCRCRLPVTSFARALTHSIALQNRLQVAGKQSGVAGELGTGAAARCWPAMQAGACRGMTVSPMWQARHK